MSHTLVSSELLPLRDGLVVSAAALHVLWRLEERGLDLRVADDGRLHVTPSQRLTSDDCTAIRVHRDEIVALVKLCEAVQ